MTNEHNAPTDETATERPAALALLDAYNAVCGPRNKDYGPPVEDFECQAYMMSAYLTRSNGNPVIVRATDIPALMACVKLARQAHCPKRDNWVDLAGYAACGAEVDAEYEERGCL